MWWQGKFEMILHQMKYGVGDMMVCDRCGHVVSGEDVSATFPNHGRAFWLQYAAAILTSKGISCTPSSAPPARVERPCPGCGRLNDVGVASCYLCGGKL